MFPNQKQQNLTSPCSTPATSIMTEKLLFLLCNKFYFLLSSHKLWDPQSCRPGWCQTLNTSLMQPWIRIDLHTDTLKTHSNVTKNKQRCNVSSQKLLTPHFSRHLVSSTIIATWAVTSGRRTNEPKAIHR